MDSETSAFTEGSILLHYEKWCPTHCVLVQCSYELIEARKGEMKVESKEISITNLHFSGTSVRQDLGSLKSSVRLGRLSIYHLGVCLIFSALRTTLSVITISYHHHIMANHPTLNLCQNAHSQRGQISGKTQQSILSCWRCGRHCSILSSATLDRTSQLFILILMLFEQWFERHRHLAVLQRLGRQSPFAAFKSTYELEGYLGCLRWPYFR